MPTNQLRVRAAGTTLVPDLDAQAGGVRRFVGRVHQATHDNGVTEWAPTPDAQVVTANADYLAALRCGELEAADEETAKAAGLRWSGPHAEIQDAAPSSFRGGR
jgi:hypothetical protein